MKSHGKISLVVQECAGVQLLAVWLVLMVTLGASSLFGAGVPATRFSLKSLRYDSVGNLHQVYARVGDPPMGSNFAPMNVVYRKMVAGSGTWGAEAVVADAGDAYVDNTMGNGSAIAGLNTSVSLVLDGAQVPHVFVGSYTSLYHYKLVGGIWTLQENISGPGFSLSTSWLVEMGPTGHFHVLYFNEETISFENRFGTLYHATNGSGSWVFSTVATGCWGPHFLGRMEDSFGRPFSLAVDAANKAHVTYCSYRSVQPVSGGTQINSALAYASNATGAWISETLAGPGLSGWPASGDGGLGANVAISPSGTIAVAAFFLPRAGTGSPGNGFLYYRERLAANNWTLEQVATAADGYMSSEGNHGTGASPDLEFTSTGVPHIAFSDFVSNHLPGQGAWSGYGQIRQAFKEGGGWQLRTMLRQGNAEYNFLLNPCIALGPNDQSAFSGHSSTTVYEYSIDYSASDVALVTLFSTWNGGEMALPVGSPLGDVSAQYAAEAESLLNYYMGLGQANLAYHHYYGKMALSAYFLHLASGDRANAELAFHKNKGKSLKYLYLSKKKPRLGKYFENLNLALGYKKFYTIKGNRKLAKVFYDRYMRIARASR